MLGQTNKQHKRNALKLNKRNKQTKTNYVYLKMKPKGIQWI